MKTLSRAVVRGSAGGDPLPAPFASWGSRKMLFRRASVSMIFGQSASFKTMITLNAVINMKVPTLMFSTDSDQDTIASRLLAIATGTPTETTEQWLSLESDRCERHLQQYDFIQWEFMPDPTLDDVWLSTYAYAETHGCWPEQIVIDIASDIGVDTGGDEWSNLRDLMRQAKVLARETGAHVLLVHHASDSKSTTRPCPAKPDMQGKVSAIPALIITSGMTDNGELRVACVKNRHARCDPSAADHFRMMLAAERAYVGDYVEIPRALAYASGWGTESEGWE